jgi:hypothetical protein
MWPIAALLEGLTAGVVTLLVLGGRAAAEGRTGVEFTDLWTAGVVGIAVGVVGLVSASWMERRRRQAVDPAITGRSAAWRTSGAIHHAETRDRFDQFTESARHVLTLAQDEAMRFNHTYIGTEHLLLGLIRERDGTAAPILESMNIELAKVRTEVELIIGRGDRGVFGEVGLTPSAKRVIELSISEARRLGHRYIGTEHLLLGLIREKEGIASGVLESLGVDFDTVRRAVIRQVNLADDAPE